MDLKIHGLDCVQKKAMGRLNYITIVLIALGEWL